MRRARRTASVNRSAEHRLSDFGALCIWRLGTLKADGFADWLIRSFGGNALEPVPGSFMYDEPEYFSEKFRPIVPELTPETREIARNGLELAIAGFDHTKGTPLGFLIILAAGEDLVGVDTLERAAHLVINWFPIGQALQNALKTEADLLGLREILEVIFRRLIALPRLDAIALKPFAAISVWAKGVFDQARGTLNSANKLRRLTPIYAPLYMLALTDEDTRTTRRPDIERRLIDGFLRLGDEFTAFYQFRNPGRGVDATYPYDLDRLLQLGEEYVERLRVEQSFASDVFQYIRGPHFSLADPFGLAAPKFDTTGFHVGSLSSQRIALRISGSLVDVAEELDGIIQHLLSVPDVNASQEDVS